MPKINETDERLLIQKIFRAFQYALMTFYQRDSILFDYGGKDPVQERCMVFRIAYYMLSVLDTCLQSYNLNLDCEYSRSKNNVKKIEVESKPGKKKNIEPDLIIHQRKEYGLDILAIEFKKTDSYSVMDLMLQDNIYKQVPISKIKKIDEDRKKLVYLTDQSKEYKYRYGFSVILSPEGVGVDVYKNGGEYKHFRFIVSENQWKIWRTDSNQWNDIPCFPDFV